MRIRVGAEVGLTAREDPPRDTAVHRDVASDKALDPRAGEDPGSKELTLPVGLKDRQAVRRNRLEQVRSGDPQDPFRIVLGLKRARGLDEQPCEARLVQFSGTDGGGRRGLVVGTKGGPTFSDHPNVAPFEPCLRNVVVAWFRQIVRHDDRACQVRSHAVSNTQIRDRSRLGVAIDSTSDNPSPEAGHEDDQGREISSSDLVPDEPLRQRRIEHNEVRSNSGDEAVVAHWRHCPVDCEAEPKLFEMTEMSSRCLVDRGARPPPHHPGDLAGHRPKAVGALDAVESGSGQQFPGHRHQDHRRRRVLSKR